MNTSILNAWAKPLFDFLANLQQTIQDFPGDASMLLELERQIRAMPEPDFAILAEDVAAEMSVAVVTELEQRSMLYRRTAAFAAENPGFAPIASAIEKIASKTPIVSSLRTGDWERTELALRERGQFSAGVESIRVMATVQDQLLRTVSQKREALANGKERYVSRDSFVRTIRQIALDEGLDTGDGNVLTNIAAPKRIGLIYDMQTQSAAGYARWKLDNDADALAILPAWRLTESTARNPRGDWWARWMEAGAKIGWEGASRDDFVALKTSPIWTILSRFGTPWPPFDFGSTRELEDVWRDEAEALGLVRPDETIEPTMEQDFNAGLEASASDWSQDQVVKLKEIFGDQIDYRGGKIRWQGSAIKDLVDRALTDRQWNGKAISIGKATPQAIEKAKGVKDLNDVQLKIDASHIRKTWKKHGPIDAYEPGSGERDPDQLPISPVDYEVIPHLWRTPDEIRGGDEKGDVLFVKKILGQNVGAAWTISPDGKTMLLKTLYKWK